MKPKPGPKPKQPTRPTQAERRAATITKLLDATVEVILAVGYSRTTVKEICRRADLSDGALFRFFPTLLDLVLAAVSEVGQRQIALFESRFAAVNDGKQPLTTALSVLRDVCRSDNNVVFFELLVAARTDASLRQRLRPMMEANRRSIRAAASRLPGIEALAPDVRDAVVFGIAHVFEGEVLVNHVSAQRADDEQRLTLLKKFLAAITNEKPAPPPRRASGGARKR